MTRDFRQRSYIPIKRQTLSQPDSELLKLVAEHQLLERNLQKLIEDEEEEEEEEKAGEEEEEEEEEAGKKEEEEEEKA